MRKPPPSLLAAYLLFGVFMVVESRLRQGKEAQASAPQKEDQGTTRLLGAAYGAGLLSMPVSAVARSPRSAPALIGPAVMATAIGLRGWAAQALGRFYTRTLRTVSNQQVVRTGPYRYVRHPGYLADILMWVGFGLSTRDWLTGLFWGAVMSLVYRRRIEAEEAMLLQKLGHPYEEYMATTPRLIPGVRVIKRAP